MRYLCISFYWSCFTGSHTQAYQRLAHPDGHSAPDLKVLVLNVFNFVAPHHTTDGVYNIDFHNQISVSSMGVNITLDMHSYTLVYLLGLAFFVLIIRGKKEKFWWTGYLLTINKAKQQSPWNSNGEWWGFIAALKANDLFLFSVMIPLSLFALWFWKAPGQITLHASMRAHMQEWFNLISSRRKGRQIWREKDSLLHLIRYATVGEKKGDLVRENKTYFCNGCLVTSVTSQMFLRCSFLTSLDPETLWVMKGQSYYALG